MVTRIVFFCIFANHLDYRFSIMRQKLAFIINPNSGNGPKDTVVDLIHQELDASLFVPEVVFTNHARHGRELAARFVEEKFYGVVAVGGDGTVNEVARALIHTPTALGIIPVGSGNGLARHLSIPMSVKSAIRQLNNSETIFIDYGLVNNNPFFCTCGTGFDAYVSTEFAKGTQRGIMAYLEKIITGYFNYKPTSYQLKGEGIDIKSKAFVLTFANASQWGNNAYIAPQASVQDGKLDISLMSNFPMLAIPSLALELFTKTIDKGLFMTTLRAREVTLIRDVPGPFHYDGEPYEEGTRIQVKIVEDGLKVLVKKRF
jgi:YegS/Rv2252/BmrU family lipid kinase